MALQFPWAPRGWRSLAARRSGHEARKGHMSSQVGQTEPRKIARQAWSREKLRLFRTRKERKPGSGQDREHPPPRPELATQSQRKGIPPWGQRQLPGIYHSSDPEQGRAPGLEADWPRTGPGTSLHPEETGCEGNAACV